MKPENLNMEEITEARRKAIAASIRTISVEELEGAVRDLPTTKRSSLALQADKKASFGIIIKVMDALKLAGVKNLPAFTREGK